MPAAEFTVLRWRLRKAGYAPVPVAGKRPVAEAWQKGMAPTAEDILAWQRRWPHATSTGILTRTTPALDIDILDPDAAEAVEGLARRRFSDDGTFMVRFGLRPKRAVLLQTIMPFGKLLCTLAAPNGNPHRLEVLGDGQQIVVAGIHPDTNKPYSWHGGEPAQVDRADLPPVTEDVARAFLTEATALLASEFGYRAAPSSATPAKDNLNGRVTPDWARMLTDGVDEGERDGTVTRIAGHLLRRHISPHVALVLLQSWNATSCRPPLPDKDILRIVNSIAGRELKRRSAGG